MIAENIPKDVFKLEDSMVLMKKSVAEALSEWNSLLLKLDRKKDDKQKTKSTSSEVIKIVNKLSKYLGSSNNFELTNF